MGHFTMPTELGKESQVLELAEAWGADAIRDSDGTVLSKQVIDAGYDIYSTICLVRADQKYVYANTDKLVQKYLMSSPAVAPGDEVVIPLLKGYFSDKYRVNRQDDPKRWWQVIDRTTGETLDASGWDFIPDKDAVVIRRARKFHIYTVNFLVYQIWDSTSMYNHLSNNWQRDHVMSVDPYHKQVREHLMGFFDDWLREHEDTDVVRLTTLAYHFVIDSDEQGKDKYRDWLGYGESVSIEALNDFERRKGYRLTPEDFVDQGYYNATHRVPSQRYLDWMDFIHKFVVQFGRELVSKIHQKGKKAAIFWGDHWIGVEPYSPEFQEMGIDINIGACEDGVALRRLSDSPGPQTKEIRLYPYFFPDVFNAEGKPIDESISNWVKIRRAMLRRTVDRMGYGGYPSLTLQFPDFVGHVAKLADEFREILAKTKKTRPHTTPIRVAVLNAWGGLRSWINSFGVCEKFNTSREDITVLSGSNLLECLSGLPVDVEFISFQDIKKNGIDRNIDVIINDGDAGTAWSGGRYWIDHEVISAVREWIYNGGGFIGARGPSACEFQGRFFQLSDAMGVDKEMGSSLSTAACRAESCEEHFITEDASEPIDFGVHDSFVYPCCEDVKILRENDDGHILLAVNEPARGRAVYMAGLPYNCLNARLLYRSILWAAHSESAVNSWFSSNPNTDCAAFPETNWFVVVNNTAVKQTTSVYDGKGRKTTVVLSPYGSRWSEIASNQS